MATTVRISERANRKLDTLQARIQLRSRKRVTKQTILEDLIGRAIHDEPLLLIRPPQYPLSKKALRALSEFPLDWGVETREEDIDEILYGGEK